MSRVLTLSLRFRIFLLVLVAVVPAFGLTLYTAEEHRQLAAFGAQQNALTLARSVAQDHQGLIEGARQLLVALAQLPSVKNQESQQCTALFRSIQANFLIYTSLIATTPGGDVFCSSAPISGPVNILDRPNFQRVLKTRGFVTSGYLIGRVTGKQLIGLSYPSIDEANQVRAVVAAGLDLDGLDRLAAKVTLPKDSTITIIDSQGTVLARHPHSEAWIGKSIADAPAIRAVLKKYEGIGEFKDLDGAPSLFGFARLAEPGDGGNGHILFSIPTRVAYVEANRILKRNLFLLAVSAAFSFAGALILTDTFVLRKVKALASAAKKLSASDFEARSGLPHGGGELDTLAQAFDEMAEALQKREVAFKDAADALRESEEQYRVLVDNSADAIVINTGTERVFVNRAFLNIHGLNDVSQGLGPMDKFIHPDDRRFVVERTLARQRGNSVPAIYEYRVRRPDGVIRTVQTSATPITYKGQRSALAIIRDITEIKKMEDALRAFEQRLTKILDIAADAIISIDEAQRITSFNQGAEKIFYYAASEVIGQPLDLLVPQHFIEAHRRHVCDFATAPEGTRRMGQRREVFGRRKDGTKFPAEASISKLTQNGRTSFIAILRDITDRKEAERKLVHALWERENIMETVPDILYMLDLNGNLIRWNRKLEEVTGFSAQELKGRPALSFFPEEEKNMIAEAIRQAYEKGFNEAEGHLIRKNGSTVLFHWAGAPLRDEQGHLLGLTGIGRNITERKQIEDRIRQLNNDLERRAIELEATNKELEAFCYSVSHDLRAPLRAIDGFSQALLEDYAEKLDGQGKDYVQRIRGGTQRMAQLIDDLLHLSRVTRTEMYYESVDLSDIARSIVETLQRTDPERRVVFRIANKTIAKGDPRLMRIVLENLLSNAWKFTSTRRRAFIEFGSLLQDGHVVYFVSDDGVGFDMAYADKLFSPFQRLHARTEFPGTGIGLATVQRIIQRHGGRVWAQAGEGTGAILYFTLGIPTEAQNGEQNYLAG